jgi:hypothetical protein
LQPWLLWVQQLPLGPHIRPEQQGMVAEHACDRNEQQPKVASH